MDRFKEKLGPWPVWLWGVILGLLIVGFMWFRRRNANEAISTQVEDTPQETSPNAQLLAGINTSGIPVNSLTGATTVPDTAAATNASWLSQGIKRATDMNYTPLDAETALRKYLNGTSLSQREAAIVNAIVAAQGSPPQGTAGVPEVTAPDPEPSTEYTTRQKQIVAAYEQFAGYTPTRGQVLGRDKTGKTIAQIQQDIIRDVTTRNERESVAGTQDRYNAIKQLYVTLAGYSPTDAQIKRRSDTGKSIDEIRQDIARDVANRKAA